MVFGKRTVASRRMSRLTNPSSKARVRWISDPVRACTGVVVVIVVAVVVVGSTCVCRRAEWCDFFAGMC